MAGKKRYTQCKWQVWQVKMKVSIENFWEKKSFIFTCHKCPIQLRVAKMPAIDLPFVAGLACGENTRFIYVWRKCLY